MHLAGFDLYDLGDNLIKKITVMGYNKYSSRIIQQISFQPGNAFHIQVVGRLIQKKDIRLGEKKFAQRHTGFLAAGKSVNLFVENLPL